MIPQFAGGYTRMPNYFLDEQLGQISPASFAVLAYICRRTLGFNQTAAKIPLNQFLTGLKTPAGNQLDNGAGLSNKRTLLAALGELRERGLIEYKSVRGQETTYTVLLPAPTETHNANSPDIAPVASADLPPAPEKASGRTATAQVAELPLAYKRVLPSGTAKFMSRKKELEKKSNSRSITGPVDFSKFEPGGKYHKLVK